MGGAGAGLGGLGVLGWGGTWQGREVAAKEQVRAAKEQVRGAKGAKGSKGARPRVDPETVRRMERATGALGTAAIAAMDERLPWYRKMSAENRSWLGLVAQAGIAAFLDWIRHPERNRPAVTEVFGTAPRELARAVSLQHAVEMVRVIIDAVEAQVDELAVPGGEAELREAVLTYAREIAFSAAQVYARTAEARGAWDARLEALVVDSLVRRRFPRARGNRGLDALVGFGAELVILPRRRCCRHHRRRGRLSWPRRQRKQRGHRA